MCSPDCFLAILAILFPPIAVWIKVGVCSADSLINIALCCLGYVPGLLHAWYIVLKHPEPDDEYLEEYQPIAHGRGYQDPEGNRITYYYVAHDGGQQQRPQDQRNYGTTPPFAHQQYAPPPPVPAKPSAPGQQPQSAPNPSTQSDRAADASGESSENRAPPTYAEAVKADNKIQTQD